MQESPNRGTTILRPLLLPCTAWAGVETTQRESSRLNAWVKLSESEYAAIWGQFYSDFKFKPDYYERSKPAIAEPSPFVTFDLSTDLTDETRADLDRIVIDSFRAITPSGRVMYSLDWQHTCYRFDPHIVDGIGPIGWFPDGDYSVFLTDDVSCGMFGHSWQQSLCVVGPSLVGFVARPLRDTFTVLRESTDH